MSELTPETLPIWDEAHEKTAQALVQLAEMNESFGEAYKAWRYIDKIDSHWHIAQLLLWRKLDLDAQKADRAHLEALERRERVGDRMHDFLCRLFSNPRLLPESFAPEAWALMQDWTAPPPEAALRSEEET